MRYACLYIHEAVQRTDGVRRGKEGRVKFKVVRGSSLTCQQCIFIAPPCGMRHAWLLLHPRQSLRLQNSYEERFRSKGARRGCHDQVGGSHDEKTVRPSSSFLCSQLASWLLEQYSSLGGAIFNFRLSLCVHICEWGRSRRRRRRRRWWFWWGRREGGRTLGQ
jgi:hypothetical protein